MTDRVKGFTVTLNRDIRDDDFEKIINAVYMINGVAHVEPTLVTIDDHMNREVIKRELINKIYEILK